MARKHLFAVAVLVAVALGAVGCVPPTSSAPPPATPPLAGTLLAPGAPNPYGPSGRGEFVASCTLANRATVDPIVAPGNTAFWHVHDFFGNKSTNANSTIDTLLGQPTTCSQGFETAAYWIPTLKRLGAPVSPTSANFFYRVNAPEDPAKVQAFPSGLTMIAGSASATSVQPGYVVQWSCVGGTLGYGTIPSCHGKGLVLTVRFPECWDGVHLDSADHKSHMAYASTGGCPADHPVLVPQLVFQIQWPVSGPGVSVSSDHTMAGTNVTGGLTAHGDFINSWNFEFLFARVLSCLQAAVICDANGTIVGS